MIFELLSAARTYNGRYKMKCKLKCRQSINMNSFIRQRARLIWNFKKEFNESTPVRKFSLVSKVGASFLRQIGINILDPNYEPSGASIWPGLTLFSYFSLAIFPSLKYTYSNDALRAYLPYCVLGVYLLDLYPFYLNKNIYSRVLAYAEHKIIADTRNIQFIEMDSLKSFRKRIEFVRNFKQRFDEMKPLEKCVFVRNVGVFFHEIIGVAIMNPEYENSLLSILPGLALSSYYIFLIYTTYFYRCNALRAILPYCVLGVVVPVSSYCNKPIASSVFKFMHLSVSVHDNLFVCCVACVWPSI